MPGFLSRVARNAKGGKPMKTELIILPRVLKLMINSILYSPYPTAVRKPKATSEKISRLIDFYTIGANREMYFSIGKHLEFAIMFVATFLNFDFMF